MALNFYSGVDDGGSADNQVNMDITTTGNSKNDQVILSDDGNELHRDNTDITGGWKYVDRFHYWSNTDGGVIGPFAGPVRTFPSKLNYWIPVRTFPSKLNYWIPVITPMEAFFPLMERRFPLKTKVARSPHLSLDLKEQKPVSS